MNELVSICWTTHHEPVEMLQKSLDSIDRMNYDNIEVIMVDDCSVIPGVSEFLDYYAKTHKNKKFIHINLPENVGFGRAKNIGIYAAKGELIMCMDADMEFIGEDMASVVNLFSNNNNLISAGFKIKKDDSFAHWYIYDTDGNKFIGGILGVMRAYVYYENLPLNPSINECDARLNDRFFAFAKSKGLESVFIPEEFAFVYEHKEYNRASNFSGNKKALFLDRDGVINKLKPNYVKSINEFEWLPNTIEALQILRRKFDYIFIVTNQQCVGKGIISEDELDEIHRNMFDVLSRNDVTIDKLYVCYDLEESDSEYRKPNTGLGRLAMYEFQDFDFNKSYMVGDMNRDIEFGNRLGMKTVVVNKSEGITVPYNFEYDSLYDFAMNINNN